MTKYRHCVMRNGTTHTSGYIEERGAIVGKFVELLDQKEPEGLWEVVSVGDKTFDKAFINDIEKNSRNHRKATDI